MNNSYGIQLDVDYEDTLETRELEPEQKLWAAVLSLALIDAADGDVSALRWLDRRGGEFSLISRRYLGLNEGYLCALMKWKRGRNPTVLYGRTGRRVPA